MFLKRNRGGGEVDGWAGGETRERRGRENFGWVVKTKNKQTQTKQKSHC